MADVSAERWWRKRELGAVAATDVALQDDWCTRRAVTQRLYHMYAQRGACPPRKRLRLNPNSFEWGPLRCHLRFKSIYTLREHYLSLSAVPRMNKVFCSEWLSSDEIIFATKCNRIFVWRGGQQCPGTNGRHAADTASSSSKGHWQSSLEQIPMLDSSSNSLWNEEECQSSGVHALRLNPSGTMVATGGRSPSDVAVYTVPQLRPVAVGDSAHSDWLFDLVWLDDQLAATAGRDGRLAVWKFNVCDEADAQPCQHVQWRRARATLPTGVRRAPAAAARYPVVKAMHVVRPLPSSHKLRCLSFALPLNMLSAIAPTGTIHNVDVATLRPVVTRHVTENAGGTEMVCATHSECGTMLCVGSKTHYSFYDARTCDIINQERSDVASLEHSHGGVHRATLEHYRPPMMLQGNTGVRSVSWRGPLVTVGTGAGKLLFYDVRNRRPLPCNGWQCPQGTWTLRITQPDDRASVQNAGDGGAAGAAAAAAGGDLRELGDLSCPMAVYTHSYDATGARLFVGGGPIAASVDGCYAALWS